MWFLFFYQYHRLVMDDYISFSFFSLYQVRIHSFLEKTKNYQRKKTLAENEEGPSKEKEILRKRINGLVRRKRLSEVQKLLRKEEFKPWGRDTQAKVCDLWTFCSF